MWIGWSKNNPMDSMKGLKPIFDEVLIAYNQDGVKEHAYLAKPIGQNGAHYCGVDHSGNPCLLIKTVDSKTKPPIKLETLEVLFSSNCEISFSGSSQSITLTSIVCKNADKSVHSYFVHISEVLLDVVGGRPGIDDVYTAVNQLVSLLENCHLPLENPLLV